MKVITVKEDGETNVGQHLWGFSPQYLFHETTCTRLTFFSFFLILSQSFITDFSYVAAALEFWACLS